jgi:UDP-GlcNAc:undecaprenyl-phosphate/decaprenyl-phosphate GlcNAc-1-phosphate transferase
VSAIAAIVALPVAFLVLWALLRIPSIGDRLTAVPSGERWHERPTPLFGGLGIVMGLLAGVGAALAVGALDATWQLGGILGAVVILAIAGLIDDVWDLSPIAKLAAQFGAAGLAAAAGLRLELVDNELLGGVLAVFWLVAITNALNLLDNMDGLAATLATVACAYFAIDAALNDATLVLVLALALGFACCGFLPFNLRPGRKALTFMGDSGSQVLGFLLAALGILSSWKAAGATATTVLLPLLVLAVPILDTTLVTITRVLERRPVTQGGKDHSSHRLVYYGLSETRAVLLLALVAVAVGATSVAYNVLDKREITTLGVLVTFVLLVQFGNFLTDLDERTRRGQVTDVSIRHALVFEPKRLVEVLVDFVLVTVSFGLAYLLVVGGEGTDGQKGTALTILPIVLGVRYLLFVTFRMYRRVWRFATPRDAAVIVFACVASELIAFLLAIATRDLEAFPKRILVVDVVLCAILVLISRLAWRLLPELGAARGNRIRVLVVGAGREGRSIARNLRDAGGARVVGFLDDNPSLHRRRVQGVAVLGGLEEIVHAIGATGAQEIVVSIPNAPRHRLAHVESAAIAAGVTCKFVHRRTETLGAVPSSDRVNGTL